MSERPDGDTARLRVCALYPHLMNMYADRGNLMVLRDRCRWRGIGFELTGVGIGQELDGRSHDLYYLGGGQDSDQRLCADDLVATKRAALESAVDRGALVLGICGGFQLLGNGYDTDAGRLRGLGLVDAETVREPGERLVGEAVIQVSLPGMSASTVAGPSRLAGFENHGGRTYLGGAEALGQVLRGHGNNGRDGTEGVCGGPQGNVLGSYLHGPLLAQNAWFADWLIARAVGEKLPELAPLDDTIENAVWQRAVARV